jgi:hypothetical protein
LRGFREALAAKIDTSKIGPAHIENIFRTQTQSAFAVGQAELADNPIVRELFPYARYDATHDARTRPDHLALEKLGISGTNIYRADDPMWQYFTPPWGFSCRCTRTIITIATAARLGVVEAQEWLRTSRPPETPEHRLAFINFRPPAGFVGPGRMAA